MAKKKDKDIKTTLHSTSSFYSDLYDETTFFAVLVRSPVSSGTIRSIKCNRLPQNYSLFTSDDLVHEKTITVFENTIPIFAHDKISYKGEPIGILVGPDYTRLCRLLSSIEITFTEEFTEKTNTDATIIKRNISYGSSKKSRESKIISVQTEYSIKLDINETQETNGALCYSNNENIIVYTPTQWFSNLQNNLCAATGYKTDKIIIHKTKMPLSDKNVPWNNTLLSVQCALASIWTGKTVLLSLSPEEQKAYDDFRHTINIQHSSDVDIHGRILHCDVKIDVDAGSCNPFSHIMLDRLIVSSLAMYELKKFNIEAQVRFSNNPPASSIMRWLDYNGFFAMENHIQKIASETNLDPVEVRLQNINTNEKKFPFHIEKPTYKEVLQKVTEKSDYFRKHTTYSLNQYSKLTYLPLRGIGLATAYEGNVFLGAISDSTLQKIEVTMEMNGKVIIKVLTSSNAISEIWKEIASTILSVDKDDVSIDSNFIRNEHSNLPETMLNNIYITSQLLKKACLALQKLRFYQALPIKVSRSFNLLNKKTWDNTKLVGKPFYAYSWIAIVCEIELDIPTYCYNIRSIWVSIDAGKIMNRRRARYAVQSCVKQILYASYEGLIDCDPDVSVSFIDSNDEPKQIRELVYSALPSAITNALSQALRNNFTTFPITQTCIHKYSEKLQVKTTTSENETAQEENIDAN